MSADKQVSEEIICDAIFDKIKSTKTYRKHLKDLIIFGQASLDYEEIMRELAAEMEITHK